MGRQNQPHGSKTSEKTGLTSRADFALEKRKKGRERKKSVCADIFFRA